MVRHLYGRALCALCVLAFFGMRHSIHSTVDEQLQDRMNAVRQAVSLSLQAGNADVLRNELDEDSELRPQSDLLQVWDDQGSMIYQSAPLKVSGLPPPFAAPHTSTLWISGEPIRVLQGSTTVNHRLYYIQVAARMEEFYEALERFRARLLIFAPLA